MDKFLHQYKSWYKHASFTYRIIGITVMLATLAFTTYLVQAGIKYFTSRATTNPTISFDTTNYTLPSQTPVKLMLDPGTFQLGFARVEIKFDKDLVHLSQEITPGTTFKRIVEVTPMSEANTTGQIVIAVGINPNEVTTPPTSAFELATMHFNAITINTSTSSNLTINESFSQLADLSINAPTFSVVNATFNIGPSPTPAPSGSPTPAPLKDTVYGFEDITTPTRGAVPVSGTHLGVDFGTGLWVADKSTAAVLNNIAGAFSTEIASQSFNIPAGKVLKGIKLTKATGTYVGTNGTATTINYTVSDGVNPAKTGTVTFGTETFLETTWTQAGSTVTVTGNWDLYIDDLVYADAANGNVTYGFENITVPVKGVSAVDGLHGLIDFGQGKWVADTSAASVLSHMAGAFATDVPSQSFTLPSSKILKSLRLAKATNTWAGFNGTATTINYTISDGVNSNITGTVTYGTATDVNTNWTQAGSTITITGNWDLYIDEIIYGNLPPTPTPSPSPVPEAGINFRSANTATNGSGDSKLTLPKPNGVVANDLLIAQISVKGSTAVTTPPSGWTLIRRISPDDFAISMYSYFKVASVSEPANYTWVFNTSNSSSGGIAAYSGVDTSFPINTSSGQSNRSTKTVTAPSVTTTVPNTRLVFLATAGTNTTIVPQSGLTEHWDLGGTTSVASEMADQTQAQQGATGARTATQEGGASSGNIGQLIALTPLVIIPTPSPTPPTGDTNADGLVDDLIDYPTWLANYNKAVLGPTLGDFNSDGINDGVDFVIWTTTFTGPSATPKPTSTPTQTPTPSLSPTPTPTPSPVPTFTLTPTPSTAPTLTPTESPTPTLSPVPTEAPSDTPTPSVSPTGTQIVPGDTNGDGKVNLTDFVVVVANYGRTDATGPSQGDFNDDQTVDLIDYVILVTNWTG